MIQEFNILHPPGSGGNHLANMISLDKNWQLPIDLSCYDLDGPVVHQKIPRENNKVKIDLFHIGTFINECRDKKIYNNSKNILILLPPADPSNTAYCRLTYWAREYTNPFIFYEHTAIYSEFLVSNLSKQEWIIVQSSLLFSEDASYLMSILNQLNLNIDISEIEKYHKKWFLKIQDYIKFHNTPRLRDF